MVVYIAPYNGDSFGKGVECINTATGFICHKIPPTDTEMAIVISFMVVILLIILFGIWMVMKE